MSNFGAVARGWLRAFICISFLISLYGGMALLTATMLANGFVIAGVLSGLVLAAMTGMALALAALACTLGDFAEPEGAAELLQIPG